MYGWNDPLDREHAQRPVPPAGQPPHRSSGRSAPARTDRDDYQSYGAAAYANLPGPAEPDRHLWPAPDGYAAPPTGSGADRPPYHRPDPQVHRHETDGYGYGAADHRSTSGRNGPYPYEPGQHPYEPGQHPYEPGQHPYESGQQTTRRGTSGAPLIDRTVSTRRRPRRRPSRATVAASAAALVALAVMVGVGVTLLPIGNDQQPVAESGTGRPAEGGTPAGLTESTDAPTGTPSATTSPSAAPSPTVKPSPTTVRTKAPTRSVKRSTSPSPTRSRAATGNTGTSSVEQQVVTLVNQERAKAGCGAVTVNANLATAAQLHSDDQAVRRQMSHTGGDGSDFVQRAKRAGYQYPIGENVAMGYETAAAVMQGWMNSSGHRANILNCDARAIGVGVATGGGRLYWTQVFGSRA